MSAVMAAPCPAHVLVVDDNPLQLTSQSLHLRRAGYRVSVAGGAAEALAIAERDRPDVVLSDIMMPGTDGFRLCRSVRRNPALRGAHVVLVSGHYGESLDLRHAANCGATMFVSRGRGPAAVVRAVGEALRDPVRLDPLDDATLDAEHCARMGHQMDLLNQAHDAALRAGSRDPLTGLPNRGAFKQRLDEVCAMPGIGSAGVLLLSLVNFREINDALGPDGGDQLLREIGRRLAAAAGGAECARLCAAQYGVLLTKPGGAVDLQGTAQVLRQALAEPVVIGGIPIETRACMGGAEYPQDALLGSELLRQAGVALHRARDQRMRYVRYSPDQDPFCMATLTLAAELRVAIERGQLELWYQPKLELATGEIQSVEALVRWRHPVRGQVPPDDFIPIAENTGLIVDVTRWVLDRALDQVRRWADQGLDLGVSVNVSQSDLREPAFKDGVLAALARSGVSPSRLTLEITESTAMQEPHCVVEALGALRRHGVRISLDDFGTGQASLAHLHNLPVDEIKLDKSFVLNLPDPHSRSIASATAMLAREFGLQSVAEGIESGDSQSMLASLGFGSVQGYHLSKPLPADRLEAWISQRVQQVAAQGESTPAVSTRAPVQAGKSVVTAPLPA